MEQRKRQTKFRKQQQNADNEKFKYKQAKRKATSDANLRNIDNEKFKNNQAKRKATSDAHLRYVDDEKFVDNQNKRKRLSRNKRKNIDAKLLAEVEKEAQKKKKRDWNERDRLRDFREATKYNAIFICTCCHRRLFKETVELLTEKLGETIRGQKYGLLEK